MPTPHEYPFYLCKTREPDGKMPWRQKWSNKHKVFWRGLAAIYINDRVSFPPARENPEYQSPLTPMTCKVPKYSLPRENERGLARILASDRPSFEMEST